MKRFIDHFRVVLLDMGNTFMFGCDRFGDHTDYFATYTNLGGTSLSPGVVTSVIDNLLCSLLADYQNPECYEHFKQVADYLARIPEARCLPRSELSLLEDVFAHHEVGRIPADHVEVLQSLRETHSLGLISNIWSRHPIFETELKRAGVLDLFDLLVWSSDHGCIKPSLRLFKKAMEHFDIPGRKWCTLEMTRKGMSSGQKTPA